MSRGENTYTLFPDEEEREWLHLSKEADR